MNTTSKNSGFNPWPMSIVAFFVVAIVAAVVWVVFCVGHSSDLVAADYYEQEVVYQEQLDRMERARELSEQASVSYVSGDTCITIQLPPEHAARHPRGVIQLYRPSQANLDQARQLEVSTNGVQQLEVNQLQPGLWDVRVQWTVDDEEFFVSQKVMISKPNS